MQSLWMLCAGLCFTLMGVCVKLVSTYCPTSEIVMYRGLFGALFMFIIARVNGISLKTPFLSRQMLRGALGASVMLLWFYSISELPLAVANTFYYTHPIWFALIFFGLYASPGHITFSWRLFGAIILSFLGVIMLLQPSIENNQIVAIITGLSSGLLAALAYLQVRQLGIMGEPETRMVFYLSLMTIIIALLSSIIDPSPHNWHAWDEHSAVEVALLFLMGLFASMAQLALSYAYRLGPPLLTANLSYSAIVFSSLLGIIIWEDELDLLSWAGIIVIILSGMLAGYVHVKRGASPVT